MMLMMMAIAMMKRFLMNEKMNELWMECSDELQEMRLTVFGFGPKYDLCAYLCFFSSWVQNHNIIVIIIVIIILTMFIYMTIKSSLQEIGETELWRSHWNVGSLSSSTKCEIIITIWWWYDDDDYGYGYDYIDNAPSEYDWGYRRRRNTSSCDQVANLRNKVKMAEKKNWFYR